MHLKKIPTFILLLQSLTVSFEYILLLKHQTFSVPQSAPLSIYRLTLFYHSRIRTRFSCVCFYPLFWNPSHLILNILMLGEMGQSSMDFSTGCYPLLPNSLLNFPTLYTKHHNHHYQAVLERQKTSNAAQ